MNCVPPNDVSDVSREQIRVINNCRVYHAEVFGVREAKYGFLDAHDLTTVKYKELSPKAPYYFFVPKDFSLEEEYNKGFRIDELMNVNGMGVTTGDDSNLVGDDSNSLFEKVMAKHDQAERSKIRSFAYRPFDERLVYYDVRLLARAREKFFDKCFHAESQSRREGVEQIRLLDKEVSAPLRLCVKNQDLGGGNLALCLIRINSKDNNAPVFVTDKITDKTILSSKDNANVFPLYLYTENMGKVERTANLNPEIVAKIGEVFWRERALAYYRRFELGRTWYDVVPRSEVDALVPIEVTPDPTADRRKVKEIFRRMPPVRNERDGRVVRFPVNIAKKFVIHRDFSVLTIAHSMEALFASSARAWSERYADIPNHKEHREITGYHQYVAKADIHGEVFYVRFTVRENPHGYGRNEIHDSLVTKIESYKTESAELPNPGINVLG